MANPNIAKLKKKAADFEQKKQFDRALSLYIQLLEEAGRDLDDADLQLFNRVGDLLQRQGNVSESLAYYEKAVDVYAERGFLNNAIALCNKVLRQSPARTSVYYKLGKISATKGFKSDAKKNFLEYAERMQKSGHVDEAFRALKEFADLCPDQDDIRLMLADWLQKENRKSEAVEQLETLYLKLEEEGREAEARATIDRIKAIDPTVVPRASGAFPAVKSNDLVFLDLDDADQPRPRRPTPVVPGPPLPAPAASRIPALDGLILTFNPDDEGDAPPAPSVAIDGFQSTAAPEEPAMEQLASLVADLEPTTAPPSEDAASLPSLLTVEEASWSDPADPIPRVEGLEGTRTSLVGAHPAMAPLLDAPPLSGEEFGELSLAHDDEAPHAPTSGRRAHDLALPSNLPVLPSDGSIDLLRVMGTPLGSPAIFDHDEARAPAEIDLLSLPPVGASLGHSASLEWPVTGSETPIDLGENETRPVVGEVTATARSDEDAATPMGEPPLVAAVPVDGAHDAPADARAPWEARDTSELLAQDGSARTTDELLVVPSEEIDEETRRSLRLEFALDGDETPDAWVEAAMRATHDRSLDSSLDHLLTPLYVSAIPDPAVSPDAPGFAGGEAVDLPEDEPVAAHASPLAWDGAADVAHRDDDSAAPPAESEDDAVAGRGDALAPGEAPRLDARSMPPSGDVPMIESLALDALDGDTRTFDAAAFDAPAYDAPAYDAPAFDAASFEARSVDAPGWDAPRTPDAAPCAAPGLEDAGGQEVLGESLDGRDTSEGVPAEGADAAGTGSGAIAPTARQLAADIADTADTADTADVAGADAVARVPDSVVAQSSESETLEVLAIPEAMSAGAWSVQDGASGEREPVVKEQLPPPEFDLLDELLPPFMRHDGAETRAADVAEREALADAEAAHERAARAAGAHDAGSALDIEALRALMLDREAEDSGAMRHGGIFDDPAVTAAFREQDVELPLLDVDDLLSNGSDDYLAPLDLSDVVSDDILGSPPTFGEGTAQEFVPGPLFPSHDDAHDDARDDAHDDANDDTGDDSDDDASMASARSLTDADAPDDWPQDAAPEVLIDGEWHDEHMGDLISGEITAIRAERDLLPPRATPRWDDLAAALLWPPPDDEPAREGAGPDRTNDTEHLAGQGTGGTPPRGSFLDRLRTPRSTLSFGGVEAQLRRRLELDPSNVGLRRQLGEALLDAGNRDEGLLALDLAMAGFEQAGDLDSARGVADIVLRAVPTSVRHHQKRVEYAVRSNDRVRLVEAYVELADSLFRSGEPEKARVVYSRVIDLSPGNGRARFALGLLSPDEHATPSDRMATPPELPPLPPTAADMVSLFDRAIPRTPATTLTSISGEIPVIADGLFLPRSSGIEDVAPAAHEPRDVSGDELLSAQQQTGTAEATAIQASEGLRIDFSGAPGSRDAADAAGDSGAGRGVGDERSALPSAARDAAIDGAEADVNIVDASDGDHAGLCTKGATSLHAAAAPSATASEDAGARLAGDAGEDEAGRVDLERSGCSGGLGAAPAAPGSDRSGAVDAAHDDESSAALDESDDEIEAPTMPFPAPTLDDQIDAAFAVPALVELDRPVDNEGRGDAIELHDISVTPPLGAAAFATPFSSPAPPSPSLTPIGITQVGVTPAGVMPIRVTPIGVTPVGATPTTLHAVPQAPVSVRAAEPPVAAGGAGSDDDFVDLGSWLRDDVPVRSTRMVTAEAAPSGDEQADFDEMLRRFKQGVAANVEEEDYASHYDLGVAFKEMGLVDEAIAEFQKSLRGESHRVRSYEALGQCFVEKGSLQVAVTLLRRALETTGADDQQLVGVLYLLGYASEVLARHADAVSYYQRVFAVDIEFRDVAQRVAALEQKTQ